MFYLSAGFRHREARSGDVARHQHKFFHGYRLVLLLVLLCGRQRPLLEHLVQGDMTLELTSHFRIETRGLGEHQTEHVQSRPRSPVRDLQRQAEGSPRTPLKALSAKQDSNQEVGKVPISPFTATFGHFAEANPGLIFAFSPVIIKHRCTGTGGFDWETTFG